MNMLNSWKTKSEIYTLFSRAIEINIRPRTIFGYLNFVLFIKKSAGEIPPFWYVSSLFLDTRKRTTVGQSVCLTYMYMAKCSQLITRVGSLPLANK